MLLAAAAYAQTGTVEGRVVSATSGDAVRRASVTVRRPGQTLTVETDANGAFRVEGLLPADYVITVSRRGFLRSGTREFEIGANARISGIVVSLTPLSVISGRVVDPDGDPISAVSVSALQYVYASGSRQLRIVRATTTDDRGRYRLFDLAPGRYYVSAERQTATGGRMSGYHPSAPDPAGAAPVDVTRGGDARDVDVILRSDRLYTVRVRVTNAGELPSTVPERFRSMAVFATLIPRGAPQAANSRSYGFRQRGNVLEMSDVSPGSYALTVRQMAGAQGSSGPALAVKRSLEVAADVELDVTMESPFSVTGALSGLPDPTNTTVRLVSIEPGDFFMTVGGGRPNADGTFLLRPVTADSYYFRVSPPEGYYLYSMRLGPRTLDSQRVELRSGADPLTVLFADDGAEIAGLVLDGQDRPIGGATVALEPIAADWPDRMKTLAADSNGNFRFHDVAPGEYRVLAWTGQEPDESTAVKVRCAADGEHRITVRVR